MGVPGFFLWLMKNYKKDKFIFQKEKLQTHIIDEINSIDYFLIDANCLIHPVCFKVIAENPNLTDNDKLEYKMIKSIIVYLNKIIDYVNPIKGVYLAIDGVAPVAKIKQQRSRRFKSVADKHMWDKIKTKHLKPLTNHWNNNAITPGTVFMEKLHGELLLWAKQVNRHIIYSSCWVPAEGEHKLLQFIRTNQSESKNHSYVIYGLDADLIFLALSTKSDQIYLLREANEINNKKSKDVLNYVSIKIMRQCIVSSMEKYLMKSVNGPLNTNKTVNPTFNFYGFTELDKIRVVNDFIFMCYFLGNDFLPHIPSLDIHQSGVEYLIIAWADTMNEITLEKNQIEYLLDTNKVNLKFLTSFIAKLSLNEEAILRDNYASGRKRIKCDGDPYEQEVFKIENIQFKIEDPIQLGSDKPDQWRLRYYEHYWGVSEGELEEFSEKLVRHYLFGIKWVTQYYFDKCPSWDWYFPFDHPPFITDIAKYLPKININKMKFSIGSPIKPFMQLLAVLPPQSSFLLPMSLRKLVINPKSSLAFMYPYEFKQDFINKKKYWMGIPRLPPLDIDVLSHGYFKYKDELTEVEKARNETKKVVEF